MPKRLLVIEAHSDDSAIGAFGLIKTLREQGYAPFFAVLAASEERRITEYTNYVSYMGGLRVDLAPFNADSRLDTIPMCEIVGAIEGVVYAIKPDILICQAPSFHHDHRIVYEATVAALRPTVKFHPSDFLLMENPTYVHSVGPSTDFRPNTYCPLPDRLMTQKIDCFMSCFPSQIRSRENCLSPEGIRAWAKYRALECYTDKPYAEAFVNRMRRIEA